MEPITFHLWVNGGFILFSIEEDDHIQFTTGGPHEEGYSYTDFYLCREKDEILVKRTNRCCDCDGPLTWEWSGYAYPLRDGFDSHVDEETGQKFKLLNFVQVKEEQRDYWAEQAGY